MNYKPNILLLRSNSLVQQSLVAQQQNSYPVLRTWGLFKCHRNQKQSGAIRAGLGEKLQFRLSFRWHCIPPETVSASVPCGYHYGFNSMQESGKNEPFGFCTALDGNRFFLVQLPAESWLMSFSVYGPLRKLHNHHPPPPP